MNCPVCDGRMRAVQKLGVEVDICPDCKGVWLDRGELEKILDMFESGGPAPSTDIDRPREDRPREEYRERRGEERPREERRDDKHYDDRDRERERRDKGHEKRYDERGREIDPRTGRPRRRESWFGEIFDMFGGGDD